MKRIFKKIWKVLKSLPVIWRDEEWDFYFLLEIIRWKLSSMATYFENSSIAVGDKERAKEMRDMAQAIKMYLNPDEFFRSDLPFEVEHVAVPRGDGSILVTINKETKKPLTMEEENIYTDNIKKRYRFESEDCWNKIWDLIKEYGQGWWN